MDAASGAPASYELVEYGALLRRRWRLVFAGIVTGLLVAGAYIFLGPKAYTATTSVLVSPTGVDDAQLLAQGGGQAEINLDTEAQIARSAVVATRAQRILQTTTPAEDLLDRVAITVPPNSTILSIAYEARTPVMAQRGAQAFAKAYLDNRRAGVAEGVEQRVEVLENRVRQLTEQLKEVNAEIAILASGSAEESYARTQRNLLTQQISSLNAQVSKLRTTTITPGQVISDAERPTAPSSPNVLVFIASGLMAGLLLGLVAAALRDRSDSRIRRSDDVERLLRLPVLADIRARSFRDRPTVLPARSELGQMFHELCHSVTATLGHGSHVILVTGVRPGHGAGVVAANLSAALVRTGSDVVLVCTDPRAAATPGMFGLSAAPGLSDILLFGVKASAVEQHPVEPGRLRVIAPGVDADVASDHLQTKTTERLIAELRQNASHVVIQAPPTSTSADAQALADVSDVAIVVVEVPHAQREQVREGIQQLDRVGAVTLGAVVVPTLAEPAVPRVPRRPASAQRADVAGTHTMPMKAVGDEAGRQDGHAMRRTSRRRDQ